MARKSHTLSQEDFSLILDMQGLLSYLGANSEYVRTDFIFIIVTIVCGLYKMQRSLLGPVLFVCFQLCGISHVSSDTPYRFN